MNKVILLGNLTQAPEERQTSSDKTVAQMRLAVDRPPKDGQDAGADYVNVTVFGALADSCLRYLDKGRPILVDGHLHHSQWTTDGARRQKIEVHAHRITFLSRGSQVGAEEQEAVPVAAAVGATDDGEDIPF
jgi:single-strand DNA-binding protein